MHVPDLAQYLQLSEGTRRVVLSRTILADVETPLSAYWKLSHESKHSFLLESVTGGEHLARYSFLGTHPEPLLIVRNRTVLHGEFHQPVAEGKDPLHVLESHMAKKSAPIEATGIPSFVGGAVGMLSYEFVRYLEEIGAPNPDLLGIPDMAMMMIDSALVFDHAKNLIHVVAVADGSETDYARATEQIDVIVNRLAAPLPPLPTDSYLVHEVCANMSQDEYESKVRRAVEYISAGDCQQVLPSLRFSTQVDCHPLTLYRALRSINPSPYMFLLRLGDFDLVGASPELQVGLNGRKARVRPIAGTRWRGDTPQLDAKLAEELLADEKERAEHVMLIDLGRNDLGRVSRYGSVSVDELMVIEKYSHVMHIVSEVTSELAPEHNVYDLIRATFPAGTVSGSPKVRAMQIINELEPSARGAYAGAVGHISASGDADLCITLRTIVVKDGVAYVQAGGGVVYDSDAGYEYREACNKAKASLRAIALAQSGLEM